MSEKKFYEKFEKYYADVPDCVCSGINGYEQVLEQIFDLTNGVLILNKFEGINKEGRSYKLKLSINNKEYIFDFEGSDYFEQNLLIEFNKIIAKDHPHEKRNLIEIGGGIDIDFGIAFFEQEKEYELAKLGEIWRSEDWIFNYEQNKK